MTCVHPADCTDFSTNGNSTLTPDAVTAFVMAYAIKKWRQHQRKDDSEKSSSKHKASCSVPAKRTYFPNEEGTVANQTPSGGHFWLGRQVSVKPRTLDTPFPLRILTIPHAVDVPVLAGFWYYVFKPVAIERKRTRWLGFDSVPAWLFSCTRANCIQQFVVHGTIVSENSIFAKCSETLYCAGRRNGSFSGLRYSFVVRY